MTDQHSNPHPQKAQSDSPETANSSTHHPKAAAISAAGGGVAGAAIGKAIGGKTGAVIGAASGAVAGGLLGDTVAEDVKALEQEAMEALGIEFYENEVPAHYSREELQARSKPTS
jgi:phage tail tape-measure protein